MLDTRKRHGRPSAPVSGLTSEGLLARHHYGVEKRQRELKKEQKKEEKRQRKQGRRSTQEEADTSEPPATPETPRPGPAESS